MDKTLQIVLCGLIGSLVLAACGGPQKPGVPTVINSTSPPSATQPGSFPTPIPRGATITYQEIQVGMSETELTNGYMTEFGSEREPSAGVKFLWVRVMVENLDTLEHPLPGPEHFIVLYGAGEFKASYGHRQDYPDYLSLKTVIYQGQKVDAWLRFEIPADAKLQDLQFVYLPESFQLSSAIQTQDYTWADHPAFFWRCGG
jgi:hypothetical protein